MEITVGLFLILLILAFSCEFIDSALGMGYGTILTPILLILGFDPLVAVPAILLSQAFGGFFASIFHHHFENVSFRADSKDMKIFLIISGFGIVATVTAALISVHLPPVVLKTYIGGLVTVMGLIIFSGKTFRFSWKKMIALGIVSAFNKGISGGGFGPVVTAGQIMSGQDHKGAIGTTTLAEAPICITGFLTYLITRVVRNAPSPLMDMPIKNLFAEMFSAKIFQWELILALLIGSVLVAPFGAFTTRKLNARRIHHPLGLFIMSLGCWTLIKTLFF